MLDEILSGISGDNEVVVHVAVFTLLVLGGMGFPMPEDIPILFAGVAAGRGIVSLKFVWLSCYAGVLVADQFVYWIGYFFGARILSAGAKSRYFRAATPEKIAEIREALRRRGLIIIFVSRHLFPVRSVTFMTAGALRVPFLEFLLADALAALISVSLVLALGYYVGENITPEVLSHFLSKAYLYILGLGLVALGIWYLRRRRVEVPAPAPPLLLEEDQITIPPGEPLIDPTKHKLL